MAGREDGAALEAIRAAAVPLDGGERDWDALIELVGDARLVLLGEASHGTHEFYRARARITRRLITGKGFTAVAVELARDRRIFVGLRGARPPEAVHVLSVVQARSFGRRPSLCPTRLRSGAFLSMTVMIRSFSTPLIPNPEKKLAYGATEREHDLRSSVAPYETPIFLQIWYEEGTDQRICRMGA
jgi:hypothetical protein